MIKIIKKEIEYIESSLCMFGKLGRLQMFLYCLFNYRSIKREQIRREKVFKIISKKELCRKIQETIGVEPMIFGSKEDIESLK